MKSQKTHEVARLEYLSSMLREGSSCSLDVPSIVTQPSVMQAYPVLRQNIMQILQITFTVLEYDTAKRGYKLLCYPRGGLVYLQCSYDWAGSPPANKWASATYLCLS